MKTTWIHDGSPLDFSTSRQPGETDAEWTHRHIEALAAIFADPDLRPDDDTEIVTKWTSGGSPFEKGTFDVQGTLRAWIDAHQDDLVVAQTNHPLP